MSPKAKKGFIVLIVGIAVIVFVTGMAFIIFGRSIIFLDSKQKLEENKISGEVCETPGCINAATQILNNMDQSVQPCNDFYHFACGNYIGKSIIPDEKTDINIFYKINDKLGEQLKESIESEMSSSDPQVFKSMQTYYKTCMDINQIEKVSEREFHLILKDFGAWPVLETHSWNESGFDWIKSMYKFRKIGYRYSHFFFFGITVDLKNNSKHILKIDEPALPLSREYLLKGLSEKVVKAYYDYLVDLAVLFGANRMQASIELFESVNFAIELAKISLPKEERRNATKLYNLMTIAELEFRHPTIPWTEYMNELLAPYARVHPNEKIVVAVPNFFDKLSNLVARTPNRVMANYAISNIVLSTIPRLGERFHTATMKFSTAVSGVKARKPRWKKCLQNVLHDFHLVIDALYVRRHFDDSARSKILEMINDVRNNFRKLLIQINWMDEDTRKAALEKLDKIVSYVGYPDEFLDNQKFNEHFKDMYIYPESFLRSHLSTNLHSTARYFTQFRKPINKTDWVDHGSAATVNAYYYLSENSINFPAGILQGEFFSDDRPNYLNYGAIGFVMGHEITHGFDDQGRQFDKDGNLVDWWKPETKNRFLERANCIIEQYSNYTVKEVGLKLNGKNTQGENIADNGGLKEAYLAYKDWRKRYGQEPRLPGLLYTSQQMFWISAANALCSKSRPENLKSLILSGVHSPHEFRVNGPVSNIHEFAVDFKCPSGSPMNPIKKCTVW